MTPEQCYLFDINGYLHLSNVLSDRELAAARAAIDRYIKQKQAPAIGRKCLFFW